MRTGKCLECGLDWESANHCPDYACWQTLAEHFEQILSRARNFMALHLKRAGERHRDDPMGCVCGGGQFCWLKSLCMEIRDDLDSIK